MGTVITKIEVGDPNGQNFQEVDLEVDTEKIAKLRTPGTT